MTSVYNEDLVYPELSSGYPNTTQILSNGSANPLFQYRNDGYLFIENKDSSELEMLIIPNSRNLRSSYYQLLIDGEMDEDILRLRQSATPFFDYGYSKLKVLTKTVNNV